MIALVIVVILVVILMVVWTACVAWFVNQIHITPTGHEDNGGFYREGEK
jgi:flagellar basal body-associated protein FliL